MYTCTCHPIYPSRECKFRPPEYDLPQKHRYTLGVQSHPEGRGDFGQGSTKNISEYNNQQESNIHNMTCSNMVLANTNMKPRIQFIIMKIFMKIVQICPKPPRFTVHENFHKTEELSDFSPLQSFYCIITRIYRVDIQNIPRIIVHFPAF